VVHPLHCSTLPGSLQMKALRRINKAAFMFRPSKIPRSGRPGAVLMG
jgi:hypothetical protein